MHVHHFLARGSHTTRGIARENLPEFAQIKPTSPCLLEFTIVNLSLSPTNQQPSQTLQFQNPKAFLSSSSSRSPAKMADWGPVLVAVVLFVLLTPGLLFQLPGHNKVVEFGSMRTSGTAVIVHAVIFFGILTIFLITIGVHVYAG
ncbi:Protein of unknown function DUF3339 [Cynara cardunculus var. scolymus]|uniref:Transmembrane protein n=2 Tax=Cynara cardunculus var. scolymus TaxID=59895 RepID=A0A118JYK7_CYNCS|nr:Protein of unknown function DUF3339 [Cynara cardunculus var. scolymus]